jgi:hypothetical protein
VAEAHANKQTGLSESATTTQLQKSRRNQLNLQILAGMVLLSFAYLCIGMGALDGFGWP